MRIRLSIIGALSLWWLGGSFATEACAQARASVDRAASSGLGVGVGVGSENVSIGGHVLYYLQLREPRLRIALHAGAGGAPMLRDSGPVWGMTGGGFLGFGRRNRMVIGVIGGTMDWSIYSPYGASLAAEQILGVGLSVGWELMTRRGFFVRGGLGPAVGVRREAPLLERESYAWFVFSTSIGWKLW